MLCFLPSPRPAFVPHSRRPSSPAVRSSLGRGYEERAGDGITLFLAKNERNQEEGRPRDEGGEMVP